MKKVGRLVAVQVISDRKLSRELGTRLDREVGTRLDGEVGTRLDGKVGTRLDREARQGG